MRPGFDPWVGKIPWRRELLPTPVLWPGKFHGWRSLVGYSPWDRRVGHDSAASLAPVFLPGESHGQRSLAGYSPWGGKESDATEWRAHFDKAGIKAAFSSKRLGKKLPRSSSLCCRIHSFPLSCGMELPALLWMSAGGHSVPRGCPLSPPRSPLLRQLVTWTAFFLKAQPAKVDVFIMNCRQWGASQRLCSDIPLVKVQLQAPPTVEGRG